MMINHPNKDLKILFTPVPFDLSVFEHSLITSLLPFNSFVKKTGNGSRGSIH